MNTFWLSCNGLPTALSLDCKPQSPVAGPSSPAQRVASWWSARPSANASTCTYSCHPPHNPMRHVLVLFLSYR